MSKIKRTNKETYIKTPTANDKKINNILNRYFKRTDTENNTENIEGLIRETVKRTKIEIDKETKNDQFYSMVKDVVEEILPKQLVDIKSDIARDVFLIIQENMGINIEHIFPSNVTSIIDLNIPNLTRNDQILVVVNGILQHEYINYDLIVDTNNNEFISNIDFREEKIHPNVDTLTLIIFKNRKGD